MKKIYQVWRDLRGTTAVEFGITAPVFFVLVVSIMVFGLLLWTQLGLQHGVEMAARCASIDKNVCGNAAAIQTYAAAQTFGINPPPSTFTVSTQACGNHVSASYTFTLLTQFFGSPGLTLTTQSCFPS